MIDWALAIALGVVQGITEYLPVSSSGHLVIAQSLFGIKEPELFFDIVLHIGTLSAVFWYYWASLAAAAKETVLAAGALRRGDSFGVVNERYPGFRMVWLITAGSVPTGAIGLLFKDDFEKMFGSPHLVGVMLIVTAVVLFLTRYSGSGGRTIERIGVRDALIIGVVQGLAITPGISRSGITIATALFLGVERETAARFSFLLSIPSIVGALLLQFEPDGNHTSFLALLLGLIAAAITGAVCLMFLVAIVKRGKLSWFSYYCFAAGVFTILYVAG